MRNKLILINIFVSIFFNAQRVDLRKLVMNSDVIVYVERNDFETSIENINDHFSKSYLKIKSYQKIIKNDSDIKFVHKDIYEPTGKNDFYNDSELNEGGCDVLGDIIELQQKKYYSLIFLERKSNNLVVLAHIWRKDFNYETIIQKINEIQKLDKIKSLKERYEKTLDYYLEYDEIHTWSAEFKDFIWYYKRKKILQTDELILTEKQLKVALQKFLDGNELSYYDFVKDKYPKEVRAYYLKKMQAFQKIENENEIDFYNFKEAYERATNTYFMDRSELGVLKDKLTDDISFDEKQKIMMTLIDDAKIKQIN